MSDGRAQGLSSAGFPVGCATPGDLGQVIPFPAPATSNRACGSLAPGSPTPFTGGMRLLPPRQLAAIRNVTTPQDLRRNISRSLGIIWPAVRAGCAFRAQRLCLPRRRARRFRHPVFRVRKVFMMKTW